MSSCFFFRPMGVFEFEKFEAGTKAVMSAVVEATKAGATSIIGTLLTAPLILLIFIHVILVSA